MTKIQPPTPCAQYALRQTALDTQSDKTRGQPITFATMTKLDYLCVEYHAMEEKIAQVSTVQFLCQTLRQDFMNPFNPDGSDEDNCKPLAFEVLLIYVGIGVGLLLLFTCLGRSCFVQYLGKVEEGIALNDMKKQNQDLI